MKTPVSKLKIIYRKASSLKPYAGNARTHSETQIKQIADSIKKFGWTNPILVDKDLTVLAGHGRLTAAQQLGLNDVPTILVSHLSEAEKKAYILADNKLAENAGWDADLLSIELGDIVQLDADFSFDITGFTEPEVDNLLTLKANDNGDEEDAASDAFDGQPAVTKPGDLWLLGEHRLYCGDATQIESYKLVLGDKKAAMVFTDPPYNLPVKGFISGNGAHRHKEFAMASGEMSEGEFIAFLTVVMKNMAASSTNGALHYICMDWRHILELMTAAQDIYDGLKNLCVWNKSNAGMGSFYRSKHELIFVYKNGKAAPINNIELGKHGRYRTNVWDYAGASGFSNTREDDLAVHPTVKPVDMVSDAILDASHRDDTVLDPFAGSGTIILAAEKTGRKAAAIEIDPVYADVAVKRYESMTGQPARLQKTGKAFAEMRRERTQWTIAGKGACA